MTVVIHKKDTYRSLDRKINQTDNMVRLVIDLKRIEYRTLLSLIKSEFKVIDLTEVE